MALFGCVTFGKVNGYYVNRYENSESDEKAEENNTMRETTVLLISLIRESPN